MGKASQCIRMLELLNNGRVYKISELAEALGTNPRNIIEYRKELEEAGYSIITITGRFGGYQLDKHSTMPSILMTKEEREAISDATNYLLSRNDFLEKKQFNSAISKVFSSIDQDDLSDSVMVINRYPLAMSEEELKKRYQIFQQAIDRKLTVHFKYVSQKNIEKEYVFDPYELFMYNNAWFVIGWSQSRGDVSFFKLNRITSFDLTTEKFIVWKYYHRSDYLNEYGFKNNGEWYHVEFKALNTYAALVKERIYGQNQEVIPIDEKTTLVKVDMQNKENILVFILGFNRNIEVIEPQWLKDELLEYSKYLQETYFKRN